MICFNCGLKIHNMEARECLVCGVKFQMFCSVCKSPNPFMAKFCLNCGSKISKSGTESSVQNFDTLSESRKNVAVIFADISGFTALSEKMDPEEVREIINDCFNCITKPVYELEGTIDKYIGDCIMILFGAKYIHSDDAKRAVMCAIRMMNIIRDFSEERLAENGFSLNLSIGINFGLVVTGSVGNYFDRDYTVMGDIVNTAQRLQANAEKDTILVSESVYMETRDVVHYSDSMEIAVKNRENPVRCYRPISLNTEYSFEQKLVFVERDNELNILNSLYNRALNTSTQCVVVTGEAGIGKTRLLKEFASKIGNGIKKVWIDCTHASQNRTYFLVANTIMSILNVGPEDSMSVKQHRLASFLDYILASCSDEDIKRNYDFLGLVLGFSRDNEFTNILNSMSFESIRREIIKQLVIFYVNLCKIHRLAVIVDDIQWADENSLQIFWDVIDVLPDINAIFIFSSRYEPQGKVCPDSSRYNFIRVQELSSEGTSGLVCKLLDCKKIDSSLFDVVIKVSRGNPLYVREFVSNIKRNGKYYIKAGTAYLKDDEVTGLPSNIQNLILSNISSLDDTSKMALQAASVIGKDFNLSLLNDLLDLDINEGDILKKPAELNMTSLKSVYTTRGLVEKVYTFNHDMEREVIYESILNKNRKELHRKIGELIESRYSKEIEIYFEILCIHFYKAGMSKKAAEYYYKAALKFKNSFNLESSLAYYSRFLELTGKKNESTGDTRVINALRDVGYINHIKADYDKALEFLHRALEIANLSEDIYLIKLMIAEIYKDKGSLDDAVKLLNDIELSVKRDNIAYGKLLQMKCSILRLTGSPQALNFAKRSEKALLKARDYQNLAETMKQAGMIYFTRGDIDNAIFYMNKSYKYAEKVDNLEIMARVSGDMGIIYHSTGMVEKAMESFNRSMDISKKISYTRGNIAACINMGILYMDKGLFDKAEELFRESLEYSKEIMSKLYECVSLTNLGDIMYERGNYEDSENLYLESLDIARSISVPVEEGVNFIGLAKLCIKTDRYVETVELLNDAFRIFSDAGEVAYLCDYYICKGMYEMHECKHESALECCDRAVAMAEECRNDKKKLKALRAKGNILMQTGGYAEAVQLFDAAIILAGQIESDYEQAKGHYGRSKALNFMDKQEEAVLSLEKAVELVSKVDSCRWTSIISLDK